MTCPSSKDWRYSIGRAKADIAPGAWVHTHNLGTGLGGLLD
jgi:altronate hydrolase